MEVAASLVVSFGEGTDVTGLVVLELDGEMNGERESFQPGDEIFLRLHHDKRLRLERILATSGMVERQSDGARDFVERVLWTEAGASHELARLPAGPVAYTCYGNMVSGLKRQGARHLVINSGVMPALTQVSYRVDYQLFRLITPLLDLEDGETWPITVVAFMGAVI